MEFIEGILERITYHSPETGYTVIKIKVERQKDLVCAVGSMANINVGEKLQLKGTWANHPKHGLQFKVEGYESLLPPTTVGLEKYLGSGLIKGIGPVTAKEMVKTFGTDIIRIIEEEPEKLAEIKKIGAKKTKMITNAWAEQKEIQNVMLFLQSHEVSTTYAVKIYKQYKNEAIEIVKENPYRLADDIWGIGFRTADQIAANIGVAHDSINRVESGVSYVLGQQSENGHVYYPEDLLIDEAQKILEVDKKIIITALDNLIDRKTLIREPIREKLAYYIASMYYAELGTCSRIRTLLSWHQATLPNIYNDESLEKLIVKISAKEEIELSEEQKDAVLKAVKSKFVILTGGPGTGKTTTCNIIIKVLENIGKKVKLGSPTGRAAKRLSELSSREAKTIHRMLEFDPRGMAFKRNNENPLEGDFFVIDEVSMLDILLTNSLLKAIPNQASVLFIGDIDQLPSVGPGSVLKDIINSEAVPVIKLTKIFRQAQSSLIITNAHKINKGEFPVLCPPEARYKECNAFFMEAEEPETAVEIITDLISSRLPKKGYSKDDIQILCPMHKGVTGASNLNTVLQGIINPPDITKNEIIRGARTLREGDRIIQLRNNYGYQVFNGDMGKIKFIHTEDHEVEIEYPEGIINYDFSELDEINLAYALSVHKAQGSEYPVVIMPVTMSHYIMLQRNLLYTAVTRARKLLILVGQKKAVVMAVKNNLIQKRYSSLIDKLQSSNIPELE